MRKYDAQKRGGEKAKDESSKTHERADQSIFISEMYCACERSMNIRSPEGECRSPDMCETCWQRHGSHKRTENTSRMRHGLTRTRTGSFRVTSQCLIGSGNNDVNQSLERLLTVICPFVSETELHGVIESIDNSLEGKSRTSFDHDGESERHTYLNMFRFDFVVSMVNTDFVEHFEEFVGFVHHTDQVVEGIEELRSVIS